MLLQNTVSGSARKRTLATAIADGQEQVTYRQLDEVSNRIAQRLISSGCRPGDRVGILMAKSIPAIAGILGTLKAGAIYVPMDTSSPPIRLKRIIDVCEPNFILCSGSGVALMSAIASNQGGAQFQCGWLDAAPPSQAAVEIAFTWGDCLSGPSDPPPCSSTEDDAAHILFTSGSTGIPKGVIITHRNVSQFLQWAGLFCRLLTGQDLLPSPAAFRPLYIRYLRHVSAPARNCIWFRRKSACFRRSSRSSFVGGN